MNSCFQNLYVNYQGFGWINTIFRPYLLNNQQYYYSGIYLSQQNFTNTTQQFLLQTQLLSLQPNSNIKTSTQKSSNTQFSNEKQEKQIKQQSNMTVLKTKLINKQSKSKYLKKNTQSNISNQVLSFLLNTKKSQKLIFTLCQKENLNFKNQSINFYQRMKLIRTSIKKYISKKVLLNLGIPSMNHLLVTQLNKLNIQTSDNELNFFCRVVRILIHIFFTNYGRLAIVTSKKIHRQGTFEHLIRRRQIVSYLDNQYRKI